MVGSPPASGPDPVVFVFPTPQLYRLCWSLRNRTEERIDLEDDDWVDNQDSASMEVEGDHTWSFFANITQLYAVLL